MYCDQNVLRVLPLYFEEKIYMYHESLIWEFKNILWKYVYAFMCDNNLYSLHCNYFSHSKLTVKATFIDVLDIVSGSKWCIWLVKNHSGCLVGWASVNWLWTSLLWIRHVLKTPGLHPLNVEYGLRFAAGDSGGGKGGMGEWGGRGERGDGGGELLSSTPAGDATIKFEIEDIPPWKNLAVHDNCTLGFRCHLYSGVLHYRSSSTPSNRKGWTARCVSHGLEVCMSATYLFFQIFTISKWVTKWRIWRCPSPT